MAIKVSLRSKPISKGRISFYLDFYPAIIHPETGKPTRREFLGLYIFEKPKTFQEKDQNREIKALAEDIRAKRQIALSKEEFGFLIKKQKTNQNFLEYFDAVVAIKEKTTSESNWTNWKSTSKHLKKVFGDVKLMSELSPQLCQDFKTYLQSTLSQNSASSYFLKFREAINRAIDEGKLESNPLSKIKVIPQAETKREFLSLEELKRLSEAECQIDWLKRASLFTALTGLRFVDVQKLTWAEVEQSNELGYYLRFTQRKTKGQETLPISDQAFSFLGVRGEPDAKVFHGIPEKMGSWENLRIKEWALKAGITKNITFHIFRHTFATLQLTLGTDIVTISKMLGHKNLKTTQIYAKVIDEKKKEAANKIQL